MEKNQGLLDARVVFFQPEEAGEDWAQTDTWQKAAGIPGVTVQTDIEGREAWTFGATTSGQVVLYDAQGRLCFSGGITGARGHSGDNEGRTVIGSLLRQEKTGFAATQVFGCPILDAELTGPTAKTP